MMSPNVCDEYIAAVFEGKSLVGHLFHGPAVARGRNACARVTDWVMAGLREFYNWGLNQVHRSLGRGISLRMDLFFWVLARDRWGLREGVDTGCVRTLVGIG
jgi:hypothetical protein